MSSTALVLVCVLDLIGRSTDKLPPIRILDTRPSSVSPNADAFVNIREGVIYLIASAPAFREALLAQSRSGECRAREALQMLASIIVHEEWHLTHGADERGAYLAQLIELQRLGLGPGRPAYSSVKRSMRVVLEGNTKRPPRNLHGMAAH